MTERLTDEQLRRIEEGRSWVHGVGDVHADEVTLRLVAEIRELREQNKHLEDQLAFLLGRRSLQEQMAVIEELRRRFEPNR